jgi:hypothetical protein
LGILIQCGRETESSTSRTRNDFRIVLPRHLAVGTTSRAAVHF